MMVHPNGESFASVFILAVILKAKNGSNSLLIQTFTFDRGLVIRSTIIRIAYHGHTCLRRDVT